MQSGVAYLDASETNPALLHVIEAQEQPCQRCLAAACAAQHTQDTTGRQVKVQGMQQRLVGVVAKGNVGEINRKRTRWQRHALSIANACLGLKQLLHPFQACVCLLKLLELRANLFHWSVEQVRIIKD